MEDTQKSTEALLAELQQLRDRLAASEATLAAIQQGEVDALVVSTPQGERIFTLQSADQSYRLLVEEMQQGAGILSADGLILYGNRSFSQLLKQPLEKVIGARFQQFVAPADRSLFQMLMQQAERGEKNTREIFLIAQDTTKIPVYLSINHLNLGDSAINCIIVTDLTEQKRQEKMLASERLAHLILEQAGEAILVCDRAGSIIQASQVANQLWGDRLLHQPFDIACGLTWAPTSSLSLADRAGAEGAIAPSDLSRLPFSITSVLQGERYQGVEVEFQRPDGQVLNLVLNARPLTDIENYFHGAVVILTDITRRRQAEVALQQNQIQLQQKLAELEAIYQSAPVGLNVLDTDLRFVRINERLAEINGLPVEAHLGRTIREVLPAIAETAEAVLRPILETGEPLLNVEIMGETPANPGMQRTWLESFWPLREGDRIIGISTVCEEITERKRIEAALRRSKEELESRVAERTLELQAANDRLQQELAQREKIEQKLRQSEARYRAIVEDQTELIARFAPDSSILFVNDAYCRYFKVRREDIMGKSYNPVIYEADREKVAQLVETLTIDNPMVIIENRVVNGQGELRWTQWINRLFFDPMGNLIELQAVGRDITDLKQTEQALRESEERLQLALEASGDGIWDWNIAANVVYYSSQYFQMLGYSAEEFPSVFGTWVNILHPDDAVWVQDLLAAHLRDPSVLYQFDYRLRTQTGEWKWIANYGKVVAWDEQGNPLRMIGTHRDVNDRKNMEAALRRSEEQRRLALDLSRLGFWDLHLPTGELTWNDNHFTLLGLSPTASPPRYEIWTQCIHPEDVENVERTFAASIATHTDYEVEYRVVHPDQSIHWVMARGRAIYDEESQPLRSLGVILDISDRKHIEASLQESSRRWRSLLDNVQLVVIEINLWGKVEYANPFFLELTGYELEEVLGEDWFSRFLVPSQESSVRIVFQEVLEHNFHTHYQNPILTKAGEERMIAWSNTILRDTAGKAIGSIGIGEDITERYKVERMKAEFISVVSHELRTPLTSMQAALSLLSDKIIDPNSEEGEATIQIAAEGTDRLVRLVNDILDLERLESGKVRLEKGPLNVSNLVETAIAQMQDMAKLAEITLEAHPANLQIYADGDRLLQILTNLLSNAIKFSPPASTIWLDIRPITPEDRLDCKHLASLNGWPALLFCVRDQGRGIPIDKLESIFDRFQQVDASDSREKGGTGLGLAICRSIVRQHGGEIWVESTLGQGSTFYFTIPVTEEGVRDSLQ